ncbi:MAG: YfiR family protein [Bacteroidales bacterium]|nr:YfiR family protein [Bacteroidales bacterium]
MPVSIYAQDNETLMKAAFIERFTRFVEWPEKAFEKESTFNILILGENPFGTALETLFSTTKIKNREVKLIYSNDYREIKNCHLMYISESYRKKLEEVIDYSITFDVLTIGDTEDYCKKGIMINFFIEDEVLRFEINTGSLKKSKLKVSHLLLNVAKKVE